MVVSDSAGGSGHIATTPCTSQHNCWECVGERLTEPGSHACRRRWTPRRRLCLCGWLFRCLHTVHGFQTEHRVCGVIAHCTLYTLSPWVTHATCGCGPPLPLHTAGDQAGDSTLHIHPAPFTGAKLHLNTHCVSTPTPRDRDLPFDRHRQGRHRHGHRATSHTHSPAHGTHPQAQAQNTGTGDSHSHSHSAPLQTPEQNTLTLP